MPHALDDFQQQIVAKARPKLISRQDDNPVPLAIATRSQADGRFTALVEQVRTTGGLFGPVERTVLVRVTNLADRPTAMKAARSARSALKTLFPAWNYNW